MKHATYTAVSRPGRIVCPRCELGRMKFIDSSAARCTRCGCTLNGHVLGDLRRITSLPETFGRHACEECGHPEMRRLPDGVFHCPACGSEEDWCLSTGTISMTADLALLGTPHVVVVFTSVERRLS